MRTATETGLSVLMQRMIVPKVTFPQELTILPNNAKLDGMNDDAERKAFAARLNELCDDIGIPPKGQARQTTLAKILKVTQKGARKWLEGDGYPTLDKCTFIARRANANFEWLMTGRGSKRGGGVAEPAANYFATPAEQAAATAQEALNLALEAQRIASAWLRLPLSVRTRFRRQLFDATPKPQESSPDHQLDIDAVVCAIQEIWDSAPKRTDGALMISDGKAFAGFVASRLLPDPDATNAPQQDANPQERAQKPER